MPDHKYCYPESDVLRNKLNITDARELFEVEKELTAIRLRELQENPIRGNFDFAHLRAIHRYIFQDIYEWAGEIRTVEIFSKAVVPYGSQAANEPDTLNILTSDDLIIGAPDEGYALFG